MLDRRSVRVTGRLVPTPSPPAGAQVLGLFIKELPTDSADEARKLTWPRFEGTVTSIVNPFFQRFIRGT